MIPNEIDSSDMLTVRCDVVYDKSDTCQACEHCYLRRRLLQADLFVMGITWWVNKHALYCIGNLDTTIRRIYSKQM